jgi:hypothetical protein
MDHGHEPFDDGLVSELLGSLKIHDFRKGADSSDQRAGRQAPLIWFSARLAVSAARANPRAPSQTPNGTSDVNRDTQTNCPTIAMNAGEFERANQSDHHVL